MSVQLDLDSIEAQEAAALKEAQRLRRIEETQKAKAAAEAEAAKARLLLPAVEVASAISGAILNGTNTRLDFEADDGRKRRAVVGDVGPRVSKEETLAMRSMLNSLGRTAFEVATSDGMNGLIAHFKPGKSTALADHSFMQLLRSFDSMESGTDTMTVRSYKILLPLYKLIKRRAK
jgi:hypothetical protein